MLHRRWFENAALWIDQRHTLTSKHKACCEILRGQDAPRTETLEMLNCCFAHQNVWGGIDRHPRYRLSRCQAKASAAGGGKPRSGGRRACPWRS